VATPTVSLAGTGGTATSAAQIFTLTATVANNTAVGSPTKFEWNFGDGITVENNSPSMQHAYTTELTVFHVSVRVTFANGSAATATTDIVTADFP
jgi:PKD repeat protein